MTSTIPKKRAFPFAGFFLPDDSPNGEDELIKRCDLASLPTAQTLLSTNKSINWNTIACLHVNCRSLNAHFDEVEILLSTLAEIDVCVLSETWLQAGMSWSFYNYQSFNVCRENKVGGGVSLIVRNSLHCNDVNIIYKSTSFEYVCKVIDMIENVLVIGIYRPPNSNLEIFFNEFGDLLDLLGNAYGNTKIICLGDFNVNLLEYNMYSSKFIDLMLSHLLFPSIFLPTRLSSGSLLDNIFFSWMG
jgi:hypothetical protein